MKKVLNTGVKLVSAIVLFAGVSATASASTTYYVYQKGSTSTCDISTKGPSDYNRGSKYHLVGTDTTRSGVKKQGKRAGCSSF